MPGTRWQSDAELASAILSFGASLSTQPEQRMSKIAHSVNLGDRSFNGLGRAERNGRDVSSWPILSKESPQKKCELEFETNEAS